MNGRARSSDIDRSVREEVRPGKAAMEFTDLLAGALLQLLVGAFVNRCAPAAMAWSSLIEWPGRGGRKVEVEFTLTLATASVNFIFRTRSAS